MNIPRIFDAEVHLLPPEWCSPGVMPPDSERMMRDRIYEHPEREKALSRAHADGLFAEMERTGIEGALIMGLPWADPQRNDANNYYVREVFEENPDIFRGLGVISDPRTGNSAAEVARIADVHGLAGCKVIASWQGWTLDDPCFEPALIEMERRGMILFPHIDHPYLTPSGHDLPSALLEIAAHHPELKIVAPHLGGLLCLYSLHANVSKLLKNMLFVGSVPTTMPMIRWAVEAVGAERVAFGSDFPFNPSHDQQTVLDSFNDLGFNGMQREWLLGRSLREFIGWNEK